MTGLIPKGAAILTTREIIQVGAVTIGLLMAHWRLRDSSVEAAVARWPSWLLITVWTFMACAIILTQGNGNAFIYFQF